MHLSLKKEAVKESEDMPSVTGVFERSGPEQTIPGTIQKTLARNNTVHRRDKGETAAFPSMIQMHAFFYYYWRLIVLRNVAKVV